MDTEWTDVSAEDAGEAALVATRVNQAPLTRPGVKEKIYIKGGRIFMVNYGKNI